MPWTSPFELPGHWYKGNLHMHTRQSDGDATPEEAVAWYGDHGYDFVAITDHECFTPSQAFSRHDVLTLPGVELAGPGYHLLALGTTSLPDLTAQATPQSCVDAVTALGGMAFFAHPYWCGQTPEQIAAVHGISGIEVYNSVCERMNGLGNADVHWDILLGQGKRLWGLAVDDTHWRHGEVGVGYVQVRAPSLTVEGILAALRQGQFYASTGPKITDLRVVRTSDGRLALRVACSPCECITFHGFGPYARRYYAVDDTPLDSATCPFRSEQVYLRVEVRDHQGRKAWTNPVFVDDLQ